MRARKIKRRSRRKAEAAQQRQYGDVSAPVHNVAAPLNPTVDWDAFARQALTNMQQNFVDAIGSDSPRPVGVRIFDGSNFKLISRYPADLPVIEQPAPFVIMILEELA